MHLYFTHKGDIDSEDDLTDFEEILENDDEDDDDWIPGVSVSRNSLELADFNPLPHMPILDSSNSATNKSMMSKIWTNGVQLSDRVENIVGKESIACFKQFLLFPQCFQKLSVVDASK